MAKSKNTPIFTDKVIGERIESGALVDNGLPNVAVIDGNNFAIRNFYALPDAKRKRLEQSAENATGDEVVGASFSHLSTYIKRYKMDAIVATFDGGRDWRTQIVSEGRWKGDRYKLGYKGHRTLRKDCAWPHIALAMDKLHDEFPKCFGIPSLRYPGVEADDIIFMISKYFTNCNIIIFSADKDLVQCCKHENVYWFDPTSTRRMFVDAEICKRMNGYTPSQLGILKALVGDPSDNLEGIRGVGCTTLSNMYQRSGVYPWDFFNWVRTYGTAVEKAKYLHPDYNINAAICLRAVIPELYGGMLPSLDKLRSDLLSTAKFNFIEFQRFLRSYKVTGNSLTEVNLICNQMKNVNVSIRKILELQRW